EGQLRAVSQSPPRPLQQRRGRVTLAWSGRACRPADANQSGLPPSASRPGPPGHLSCGGHLMDPQDIAEQARFEQQLLRQVMEGLRLSTTWQVREPDASRKLSSLRFVTSSFQRHLERLLALEEDDGFMDKEVAGAPHLGRATEALRAEHDG